MDRTVLGDGGEEVSILPIVYPRGTVSISSIGSFLSVGFSYKTFHPYFNISLGELHIQEYLKNKRGRKRKLIKPQQYKARHEERIELSKVIF